MFFNTLSFQFFKVPPLPKPEMTKEEFEECKNTVGVNRQMAHVPWSTREYNKDILLSLKMFIRTDDVPDAVANLRVMRVKDDGRKKRDRGDKDE
jgi:hypothetical protein